MSEEKFCYIKPSYVIDDDITFPSTKVLERIKANLNVKHLQFQYIGVKNGLFINYPSTRLRDCDSYDPRFRYMEKCILCYIKHRAKNPSPTFIDKYAIAIFLMNLHDANFKISFYTRFTYPRKRNNKLQTTQHFNYK